MGDTYDKYSIFLYNYRMRKVRILEDEHTYLKYDDSTSFI